MSYAGFGYSLGVLHHVPDTAECIRAFVRKLKVGAPFLLYLYFAFDNKPTWYRLLCRFSEIARFGISRSPFALRYLFSQVLALFVYLPLARFALLLESMGYKVENLPLSFYRRRCFYVMRTDAVDRFGTRLEKRYTAARIAEMMRDAGLDKLRFSDSPPYWCAVGYRK